MRSRWLRPTAERAARMMGVGVVLSFAACADAGVTAPTAVTPRVDRGLAVSSVWSVSAAGLHFAGSARTHVEVSRTATTLLTTHGGATAIDLSPTEIESVQSSLSFGSAGPKDWVTSNLVVSPGGVLRPTAKGKSFKSRDANGKEIRAHLLDDSRGGDRPAAGVVIFVDDRIVAINQFSYKRDGSKWRVIGAVVTAYDSSGKPSSVSHHDLSDIKPAGSLVRVGMAERARCEVARARAQLAALMKPRELHAAGVGVDEDLTAEGGPCAFKAVAVAIAVAAEVAAIAFEGAAITACIASVPILGIACPSVVAATAAVAAATAAVGIAVSELNQCIIDNTKKPPPPRPTGGGGSGGGGSTCLSIEWEISYDGGITWQYYETTVQCIV